MRWAKTYKGNGRILSIFRVDKVLLRVNLSEAVIPQSWVQIKLRVSGNIVSSLRHKMRRVGLRVLTITWENRKFRLGNQMVHAIPFGKLQKIWFVICDDAIIFYSFQLTVSSADLDILWSRSFSNLGKFYIT